MNMKNLTRLDQDVKEFILKFKFFILAENFRFNINKNLSISVINNTTNKKVNFYPTQNNLRQDFPQYF